MGIHWSSINWAHLILINFSCAMLVIAIILFIFDWILQKIRRQKNNDVLLRWLLLLPVGITGMYVCFMNLFFPKLTAAVMSWPPSPFQLEVALANLCVGMLGILAFRASHGFRVATVIVTCFWMWGHSIAEIYQIITTSNIYLGNAVSWFWVDTILPFILISCVRRAKPDVMVMKTPMVKPEQSYLE